MTTRIDSLGFKVAMAEAIELADPVAIDADRPGVQNAIVAACAAYGPHAFALAAVSALASVFASYPGSRAHATQAITNVIAAQTWAAALGE